MRGIVDSEDMPLNVSREMLQNNPVVARIRSGLVKRVLGELKKKASKEAEPYAAFWDNFGAVLKEGIYEDVDNREALLELARFETMRGEALTSLHDYLEGMKEGQDAIYYISADTAEAARRSPQLEAFRARDVEVLLMTDPVDEFWLPAVGSYKDKPFKSVTRADIELDKIPLAEEAEAAGEAPGEPPGEKEIDSLIAAFKLALGEAVKDVRVSSRLTDSAVCLVADEGDLDMHIERLLKEHKQIERTSSRILEMNARHALIRGLAKRLAAGGAAEDIADAAHLLLDQARIIEGEPVPDLTAFARRLSAMMQKGLAT